MRRLRSLPWSRARVPSRSASVSTSSLLTASQVAVGYSPSSPTSSSAAAASAAACRLTSRRYSVIEPRRTLMAVPQRTSAPRRPRRIALISAAAFVSASCARRPRPLSLLVWMHHRWRPPLLLRDAAPRRPGVAGRCAPASARGSLRQARCALVLAPPSRTRKRKESVRGASGSVGKNDKSQKMQGARFFVGARAGGPAPRARGRGTASTAPSARDRGRCARRPRRA